MKTRIDILGKLYNTIINSKHNLNALETTIDILSFIFQIPIIIIHEGLHIIGGFVVGCYPVGVKFYSFSFSMIVRIKFNKNPENIYKRRIIAYTPLIIFPSMLILPFINIHFLYYSIYGLICFILYEGTVFPSSHDKNYVHPELIEEDVL